jgi:hypothetical protein
MLHTTLSDAMACNTEKTMEDLSPFYIQKALDQIVGLVKNANRLWDGSLVKTKTGNSLSRHSWVHTCVS